MQKQPSDPFGIVGQVLDAQFRVDRLVGEGGFSAVYRGFHLGLQEPIAIKCLKLPPTLSPPLVDQFEKRFRDESRILYKLSQGNLNIVRSIAGGTWQSPTGFVVPFMILEWLDGRSLSNEFTIRRTVGNSGRSLDEVVKLFGPAADGLGYAHSQGVVHRDLNPGNLFIASTPQGKRMKVLDFGVAKILDDSTVNIGPRTQTVGQIRIFAPAYGAPEQFDDSIGKVGAASDVYAFALILLEALRDRTVNDGVHLGEFAQKATDKNRRPTPRGFGLDVSDEVEQIFARATKLDPRERWQSAGELWQALAIASNAASVERHAQAAMETPPLAMPTAARSTKTGMGAPPTPSADRKARVDRTLPFNAVMPNLPRPSSVQAPPPSSPRAPSSPRVATPKAPASNPSPNENQAMDMKTRTGLPEGNSEEPEDEVTRVAAPNVDVLRGLAAQQAAQAQQASQAGPGHPGRGPGGAVTMTQVSPRGNPRPAAGEPAWPAAPESQPNIGTPPPGQPYAAPTPPEAPSFGGTLMMQPGGFGPLPAPPPPPRRPSGGGALAQTMPLAGQHPLGLPTQQGSGGPLPAAGATAPSMGGFQPPQQHPPPAPQQAAHAHPQGPPQQGGPQGMQQHGMQQPLPPPNPPPHMMQGHPGHHGPGGHVHHNMADAMPPGSVTGVGSVATPKSTNPLLYVGIAFGVLAILGIAGIVFYFVSGKEGGGTTTPTSVASTSPPSPTNSAPPPPPATNEPKAVADVADASTAPTAEDPTPAPTTPTPAPPATDVNPTPPPVPVPTQTTAPTHTPPAPTATVTPPAPKEKDAGGPTADPNAFNESVARSRLAQANSVLVFCKRDGWVNGPGTASVTFNTDGTVGSVAMNPPYAGTPAGDCVAGHFKRAKTNPFQGTQRTLIHSFEVPK